jgi:hypothetical protein
MLTTLEWNTEFKRLNGIPPSRMDLSAESTREYFKTISRNRGYKLPVETPAPVPPNPPPNPAPAPPNPPPVPVLNATAKQLIKTIMDAAAALDKII